MKTLSGIEELFFSLPLYAEVKVPENNVVKKAIVGAGGGKVDGHCPYCGKSSTFTLSPDYQITLFGDDQVQAHFKSKAGFIKRTMFCARDLSHRINCWLNVTPETVMKVGQLPSLADIANDEASRYRDILAKSDASELHKAIGLAAHGVGIGSFVYLRRIFERIVYGRFEEFKGVEKWADDDFNKLRMDEKVKFLEGHLPSFLVENRALYSILSAGIHELSEEVCLAAFRPISLSIKIVLEEDKKKKEELDLRRAAAAAIEAFGTGKPGGA